MTHTDDCSAYQTLVWVMESCAPFGFDVHKLLADVEADIREDERRIILSERVRRAKETT